MKIALGQIAPVVGDIDGNAALVRRALGEARGLGARLVLFPELCLTGYPPHDLLERPAFVERNLVVLRELAREKGLCIAGKDFKQILQRVEMSLDQTPTTALK